MYINRPLQIAKPEVRMKKRLKKILSLKTKEKVATGSLKR